MPLTPAENLHPKLLTENVASYIRSAIFGGDLLAGEPLHESTLASRLAVSRNTVREALRPLVGERLVTHHPHRGFFVARLTEEDIRDVFRTRRLLELGSLEGGGRRIAEAAQAAEAALETMTRSCREEDIAGLFESDVAFHLSVIQVTPSPRLASIFRTVMGELQIALATHDRLSASRGMVESHEVLLDAVRAGDADLFRRRLEDHLQDSEGRLLSAAAESPGFDASAETAQ